MFKKIREIVYAQLTQGVSPHELALTVAVGTLVGIFPMFGLATGICFLIALAFRLNQPILQLVNYGMTPIHLIMIPVFLRIGEWIVGAVPISFSVTQMMEDFYASPGLFFQNYGMAALYAVLAWALIAPIAGILIYIILKPLFVRIRHRVTGR